MESNELLKTWNKCRNSFQRNQSLSNKILKNVSCDAGLTSANKKFFNKRTQRK